MNVLLNHCEHIKVDSAIDVDLNGLTAAEVVDSLAALNIFN